MKKEAFKNQSFDTLIHSCRFKLQQPALGQYSISADTLSENTHTLPLGTLD